MSRATRNDVVRRAESLGLYCEYYGPGDGLTRYRFFKEPTDYFAGPGLVTVLGAKQAMLWLDGFEAGYKQGKEN